MLRQLLQDHLDLRARTEEAVLPGQPPVIEPEGCPRTWRERGHHRLLTCTFGPVQVTRIAHRGRGVVNVHPADEALSLPVGRHSRGLARLAVLEAVRGSFDQAAAAIERRCGKVLGKRRLEELTITAAVDVAAYYTVKVPAPCTREMALILQVDGKGVVMRPEALREATRKAAARSAAAGAGAWRRVRNPIASGWRRWPASLTPPPPRAGRTTSSIRPAAAARTGHPGPGRERNRSGAPPR
ncbi:hypothetical protein SUDANB43_06017 [Streptomyces sp. enrichment culture]